MSRTEIKVRFERTSSGYRSWVQMRDGKRRGIADDAPSCDGLAEATILAVKLALDLEPSPAGVATPDDVRPFAHGGASRSDGSSVFGELSASAAFGLGVGSAFAPGARAGASLVLGGRWSIGVTGLVLPNQKRDIGEGTVSVSVFGGGVEGCGRGTLGGSLRVALCARTEAMALEGSSTGFARTRTKVRPLFAGTLLGRLHADIAGPVAMFVEAGALLPLVRERFGIDTVGLVYDPPVVAVVTGFGVLVDFE